MPVPARKIFANFTAVPLKASVPIYRPPVYLPHLAKNNNHTLGKPHAENEIVRRGGFEDVLVLDCQPHISCVDLCNVSDQTSLFEMVAFTMTTRIFVTVLAQWLVLADLCKALSSEESSASECVRAL